MTKNYQNQEKYGLYWKKMVTLGLKVTKNFRVGAEGFEPSTFCTPSKRATSLRYAPKKAVRNQMGILLNWSECYHVGGGAVNLHPICIYCPCF